MKLFVTGGAGFIGSNYVRHVLANTDDSVTVFDALTYAGNLANLADIADDPRYRFVHGDICDRDVVTAAMAGHDAVVHFAAESHVDRSILGPDVFVRTNCTGTNVICDVARQTEVEAMVHISTDEVYGSIDVGSFLEGDPLDPRSPYSAAKAGMHGFTMALAQEVAKKGVTVNTVSPGYIGTDMVMAVPEEVRNKIIAGIPVGRLGQPEEIAGLITYLSSDLAGFITGANLAINGGQHMM